MSAAFAALFDFMPKIFPCDKCGLCCMRVGLAKETKFLDRGDGVCKFYSVDTKLCTIYEQRPIICRVDEYFAKYAADDVSWGEFVSANLAVCDMLKNS